VTVTQADAREFLAALPADSVALSVWSPPYFVGKQYESHLTFDAWKQLISESVAEHFRVLIPGGFLAINIADILALEDESLPRVQATLVRGKRSTVTREDVVAAMERHPGASRPTIAAYLGCSEQTVQRRLEGNGIRGGKHGVQTRIYPVAQLVDAAFTAAGLVLYDRRIWVKDPAWANSRWAAVSFRSVDESEYIYIGWKPGPTRVDRDRLTSSEWGAWGSRGVWAIPSVRANDDHEAKFPAEIPRRLIRMLTDPGDLVIDPFVGSGTTGVVAVAEGRRFAGSDLDANYAQLAASRIPEPIHLPPDRSSE